MTRLIDADALTEWIQILPNSTYKDTVLNAIDNMQTIEEVPSHSGLIGWVCPVCGRGLSPYTAACPCQNQKGWEITCG